MSGKSPQHGAHLLPHLDVDVDGRTTAVALDAQLEARLLARGAEHGGEVAGDGGEVHRLERGLGAARLEAREVKQRIDEEEHAARVA